MYCYQREQLGISERKYHFITHCYLITVINESNYKSSRLSGKAIGGTMSTTGEPVEADNQQQIEP